MTLNLGNVLTNRYRILELLGRGGFGAVYKAWDENFNLPCAVKENLDTSPESQRQFKHSACILRTLRHPNLPQVIDHFIIPGQGQYLVMDYVEGLNLGKLLQQRGGPLAEAEVLPWIGQICDALAYLHAHQPPVIHRDIKPQNIIISPAGEVMLVDFGISKTYDPGLPTTTGARAVTPGYSPPEQYGQGATDARSDLYALGATVYTLLTCQVPPASIDILCGAVAPPQPANQVNRAVSGRASAAILKAMQPDRTGRFNSVAEFKTALGKPQATPSSTLPAVQPNISQRPAQSTRPQESLSTARAGSWRPSRMLLNGLAGASVLVLLSLLAGGTLWLRSRLTRTPPASATETAAPLTTNGDLPALSSGVPALLLPTSTPTAPVATLPGETAIGTVTSVAIFTSQPATAPTGMAPAQTSPTPRKLVTAKVTNSSRPVTPTPQSKKTATAMPKAKPSRPGSQPVPTLAPP